MARSSQIVGGLRLLQVGVALGLLLVVPRSSQAATITFSVQGTATGIGAIGMDPDLIGVTLPFSGTFTLNDTDLNPVASSGQYNCAGCTLPVWTLEIAGLSIVGNSAILNMTTAGQFSVFLTDAATAGVQPESFLNVNLGYAAGVFTDDSLPGAIPFPIAAQSSRLQIYGIPGQNLPGLASQNLFFFPVTLVPLETPTVVPEPGTLVLFGTGLLVLARRVTRSRRA